MTLETDTLYLDRIANTAFYNSYGKIVDEESTLTSKEVSILWMKTNIVFLQRQNR